jgi:hypothetical protein
LITTRISLYKTCEAVDCHDNATETIIVSAGKFGTIELNLCYKCAVTKFQNLPSENMIAKESKEDDSRDADDIHGAPQTKRAALEKKAINIPIHNHDLFNHVMEQLIAALDKLDLLKEMRDK